MQTTNNTERQIIEAARKIFVKKGLSGARMQDIADEAGINKAMLHYYYRSKDKLFEIIFNEALEQLLTRINQVFSGDMPFQEKVAAAVDNYISTLSTNPYLPLFIINEINQNPNRLLERFRHSPMFPNVQKFIMHIQEEMENGRIRKMDPMQLLLNTLSMCIFPFTARPIIQGLFQKTDEDFSRLMEERKQSVTEFILMSLRP